MNTKVIYKPVPTTSFENIYKNSSKFLMVYENSMAPSFPPGSVVSLMKGHIESIIPGEVYVIKTRFQTLIKRLYYKNDSPVMTDVISCYSDNTSTMEDGRCAHPMFDIPLSEISEIYLVRGIMTRLTNHYAEVN